MVDENLLLCFFDIQLSDMDIQSTEHPEEPDIIARVLSPLGSYPAKSIIMAESAFISDADICFTLVKYEKLEVRDENYSSEMEWAQLEEIRLFASLLLSMDREWGSLRIYPFYCYEGISISEKIDFEDQVLVKKIKKLLIDKIDAPDKQISGYPAPQRNPYRNGNGISLPLSNGGPKYDLRKVGIDYKLQSNVYYSVNKDDYLSIRGLSTLVKSVMLSTHYQFFEEATITLFIALDASFSMVLRELKRIGIKNPSSSDAMTYIHDAFHDIYRTDKYFEEYYEGRIKTVHPESRFGVFPHAPLQADDFFDLKDDLLEVYTFLLTGYVNPKHKEKMKHLDT
jgi:hypothetical protein